MQTKILMNAYLASIIVLIISYRFHIEHVGKLVFVAQTLHTLNCWNMHMYHLHIKMNTCSEQSIMDNDFYLMDCFYNGV